MEPKKLTREEFEQKLLTFFRWSGSQPRTLTSWCSTLQDWSMGEFNMAFKKDFPALAAVKEKKS